MEIILIGITIGCITTFICWLTVQFAKTIDGTIRLYKWDSNIKQGDKIAVHSLVGKNKPNIIQSFRVAWKIRNGY